MTDFPDLGNLSNTSEIGNLMALPNSTYPYYWAWIFFGLFMIISLSLYFAERARKGTGNLLSSFAVAALAVMILSTIGTAVGFVTAQIEIFVLVIGFLIIGIWFFSN